jgi:hypothetical protein
MDLIKSSVFSVWKEFENDPIFLKSAQFNFDRKVSISYDTLEYDPEAEYKVLVYCGEPDCVLDISKQVIENQHNFDLILSWKKQVLDNCKNAEKFLFGGKFIDDNKLKIDKKNQITYLTSNKYFTEGHKFRQEIFNFLESHDFDGNYEIFIHKSPPRIDKEIIFNNSKFSIIVENGKEDDYFSEKLIECLYTKTIPIYRGCPTISEYFDLEGFLIFNTLEELIDIIVNLPHNIYDEKYHLVEKNYESSKIYWDYYGRIKMKIEEKLK